MNPSEPRTFVRADIPAILASAQSSTASSDLLMDLEAKVQSDPIPEAP
jgi:hypothetical protein